CAGDEPGGTDRQPLRAGRHWDMRTAAAGFYPWPHHAVDFRLGGSDAGRMGQGALRRPAGIQRSGTGKARHQAYTAVTQLCAWMSLILEHVNPCFKPARVMDFSRNEIRAM